MRWGGVGLRLMRVNSGLLLLGFEFGVVSSGRANFEKGVPTDEIIF